jgi:hypothetical protein
MSKKLPWTIRVASLDKLPDEIFEDDDCERERKDCGPGWYWFTCSTWPITLIGPFPYRRDAVMDAHNEFPEG